MVEFRVTNRIAAKDIGARIGEGTFLKVGRPGSHRHRRKPLRQKANLPPKPIFSSDFSHFIFAYMPEDGKKNKKTKVKKTNISWRLPPAYDK